MTKKKNYSFALCLSSEGHEYLEAWKVYRVLPDAKADEVACLRIIDESGEDYLYPASHFLVLDLPKAIRTKLLASVED